ncbi:hypothetical protein [Dishui Lake phycodnavirus 4]|nr:hypothetical protein [Dishui Lake phycodnavirus 4]
MCDVSGPSTAAVISLNAIGGQDVHLIEENIEKSFFQFKSDQRHTDYTRFHRKTRVDNTTQQKYWPFGPEGNTVKVTLNPQSMGDLLSNMYLMIELPRCIYSRDVGHHIIKSMSFRVDELEIERIYDDWQVIYSEMYLDTSERRANDYILNRMMYPVDIVRNEEKVIVNGYGANSTIPTLIPLRFFFSRKYAASEYDVNKSNRPYFPLCAMYRQKIVLEIEFHSYWFFSKPQTSFAVSDPKFLSRTNFDFPTLNNFNIITEEVTLSLEDRSYYIKQKYDFLVNLVFKNPTIDNVLNENTMKTNLVPSIPVKSIHWFVRKKAYEYTIPIKDIEYNSTLFIPEYQNNYVKDGINLIDSRFRFEKIVSARLYLNSLALPDVTISDHNYFKYYIPLQCRLTTPRKNIYTYSFSMTPMNLESTGSLDFSKFNSDKTFLDIKLEEGEYSTDGYVRSRVNRLSESMTLYVYYTGYKMFSFDKGYMSETR